MAFLCLLLLGSVWLTQSTGDNYDDCDVSVIGAGWGGAYFAYRLANASSHPASKICVFEKSKSRIGGRVYSYENALWEDLRVDIGAYRYPTSLEIGKGIAETILNAPVVCYAGTTCTATTGYRSYKDAYGNNAGYVTGIEGLLDKFSQLGGRDVFLKHKLVNIKRGNNAKPIKLVFKKGSQTVNVLTKKVFLNLHTDAINELRTNGNLLYTQGSNYSLAALKSGIDIPTLKQYVWYTDAWWLTKLNLTTGGTTAWGLLPAVYDARYGDGPVKCYKLKQNGQRQYYDHPVAGGVNGSKCYGALLNVYASFELSIFNYYYDNWVTSTEKAKGQTAIFIKQGDSRQALLNLTHQSIMTAHAGALAAAGIDPASIAPPTSTVISFWNSQNDTEHPSFFVALQDVEAGVTTPDSAYSLNNLAAKPVANYDIYVASEGYGLHFGWAEGSLMMVERVLASHFGLSRPPHISSLYWSQNVLPYLPNKACTTNAQCKSTNNCVMGTCTSSKCVFTNKNHQACNQDDLCSTNTICSYTALCYGPALVCPPPDDLCVGGVCRNHTSPPLPTCHYSNAFGNFELWWNIVGDEITMAYQMDGFSYTAFGVGSSMVNADIVVSYLQTNGQIFVGDYYSAAPGQPSLDTDLGGTNDLKNIFIESGGWFAPSKTWFTRKLNTGDSHDRVIVNGVNDFIYAFGAEGIAGQMQYHGTNKNQISVDLSVCTP